MVQQPLVMHVTLDFNGSCVPNPGQGGCGAVAYEEDGAALITVTDFPGTLQNSINFIAAYIALLLGLRQLLKVCDDTSQDPKTIKLRVRSDYEVVIKQLLGKNKVKALHLQVCYAIVTGLLSRFRSFTAAKITSEENDRAHGLAQGAVNLVHERIRDSRCLIFHPSQDCFPKVSIDGTGGTASMIDAKFLKRLKRQGGAEALRQLEDYDLSFSYVRAKEATYYILGKLPTLSFHFMVNDGASTKSVDLSPVYVVDRLPVPLHIHYDEKKMTIPAGAHKFRVDSFTGYEDHPHWAVENTVIPFPAR
ncbi:hypothetical protein HDU86_001816 [Geranomyces michiganensis]|nr:hypothetical protein HDU86_001816 [Geranomyces michiganensis]